MRIKDLCVERDLTAEELATTTGGSDIKPGYTPLGAAFRAGYSLGKILDEEYGISDAIAGTDDHPIITDEVKNAGNPQ